MTPVRDLELARLRAMTASEKIAVMQALWRQARSLTSAGIRGRHPEWSSVDVDAEARRIFLRTSQ